MCYVNPEMTAEDVEIVRRVRGYRLGPVTVHADETNDARRMRFATSQETFAGHTGRQMRLNHRLRAGVGLSPEEYATLATKGD